MGTCGSKVCNCFRPSCKLPEEKLVISKSPPPTDPVLACHDHFFDSKQMFTSSSSISCSTTAATTATTTATTVSSPSSSSSSITINSGILVLKPELAPTPDAELMAKPPPLNECPQGPEPPSKAAVSVAAKKQQPRSRAPEPLQVKRQRSTSPAVRSGPKSYRTEKPAAPPRMRSSKSLLLRGGIPGSDALHGRRRCQACSRDGNAAPRKLATRKEKLVRPARAPRASTAPKGSSLEPPPACADQVDVKGDHHQHQHQEVVRHSEVVQTAASCGETISRVLMSEELINNPLISMDCFIFL